MKSNFNKFIGFRFFFFFKRAIILRCPRGNVSGRRSDDGAAYTRNLAGGRDARYIHIIIYNIHDDAPKDSNARETDTLMVFDGARAR